MNNRFYIIPHDDQWTPEREGELPTEVDVIDNETNCPVKFMDFWLGSLPYDVGVKLAENLNWLEQRRVEEI